jgi:hypothetical protein
MYTPERRRGGGHQQLAAAADGEQKLDHLRAPGAARGAVHGQATVGVLGLQRSRRRGELTVSTIAHYMPLLERVSTRLQRGRRGVLERQPHQLRVAAVAGEDVERG